MAAVGIGAGIAGESGSGEDQVVIYSNADDEAVQAMKNALDENGYAGDHIEDSGSAPLKKVRAGEAAVGFGLRQQAVADKGADSNEKAMEMAQCIIENGREELQTYYPLALYEGETTDAANISANPKVFEEPLTVDLLEEHQELSEECK